VRRVLRGVAAVVLAVVFVCGALGALAAGGAFPLMVP
jgi:hypothetical protein